MGLNLEPLKVKLLPVSFFLVLVSNSVRDVLHDPESLNHSARGFTACVGSETVCSTNSKEVTVRKK